MHPQLGFCNIKSFVHAVSYTHLGWGQRYPVIAQIVQYHDFDIFGTQECFIHQLKDMKEADVYKRQALSFPPTSVRLRDELGAQSS